MGFIAPDNSSESFLASSTKVLTERLRRMLAYGLITRTEYPGLPLRVEYRLTPVGEKLASVIEQLRALETELSRSADHS